MGGVAILIAVLASSAGFQNPAASSVRLDRMPIAGGAELLTLYRTMPNQAPGRLEIPVVSILRDTMGDSDPANDRLRYVWVLTDRRPPWYKHVLAAVPFFYMRMPSGAPSSKRKPDPVLDLAKPGDRSVAKVAQALVQSEAFDPLGAVVRTSSRSYSMNSEYRRQARVGEALTALSDLDPANNPLTGADMQQVRARLLLSTKLLGGWVGERGLPLVYSSDVTKVEEMRGHNWDLLRQAAELNGLAFEPLHLADGPPSHALLWVVKSDVASPNKHYNGRFLKIASPWGDDRLTTWKGYTETREWEGKPTEMIPLALYSLDHPKVPHLVADMRDSFAPSRREMFRRAVTDTTAGLLGLSTTSNPALFAAAFGWQFVSSRWGAPNDRAWRIRSYAELRYRLAADTTLNPELRKELSKRANWLAINPFEDSLDHELRNARIQHAALVRWAESPKGAPAKLNKDRREELALLRRSEGERVWATTARLATLGLYRKRVPDSPAAYAELDERRRVDTYTKYLQQLVDSRDPHPEVAGNEKQIRTAIGELGRLKPHDPAVVALVGKVMAKISDSSTKAALAAAWRETSGGTLADQ